MTYVGHCGTSNPTPAAGQLGVNGIPGLGDVQVPATVSGVCILLHPLNDYVAQPPFVPTDTGGALPVVLGSLASLLLADNWVVLFPSHPDDPYPSPAGAIAGDVSTDTGHGSRYLDTLLLTWDHMVDYSEHFWPGKKRMVIGLSKGAYYALQVAANRAADIIGAIAHVPATIWSNIPAAYTGPADFTTLNTTGMDAGPHLLDAIPTTLPVLVSYGTADQVVGWQNPGGTLPTSNTDAIITNAQAAGRSLVFRNATPDNHEMVSADISGAVTGGRSFTFEPWWQTYVDPNR